MRKRVAIVGAGINGVLAAFLLSEKYPDLQISIYDAEDHPAKSNVHRGVTYGSKDARHITGSESIGFENSIHKNALRNRPEEEKSGWLQKATGSYLMQRRHGETSLKAHIQTSTDLTIGLFSCRTKL